MGRSSVHQSFKAPLDLGPLVVDDAKVHRIADVSVWEGQMLSERSFSFRPNPLDGRLRALVSTVSLEKNAPGAVDLEGVPQEKVLTFSVQRSTLVCTVLESGTLGAV